VTIRIPKSPNSCSKTDEDGSKRMQNLTLPRLRIGKNKIIAYILLAIGMIALIFSTAYVSAILAFIGLGLIFWGALILYIGNSKYAKLSLLDSTALSSLADIDQIITELKYEGKGVYLPPKYLRNIESGIVFIPSKKGMSLPLPEEVAEEKIFLENPDGACMIPPGLALSKLFEKELGISFTKVDVRYLEDNLPKLFIEGLEIAEDVKIETEGNIFSVEISGSIYNDFCQEARKLSKICNSIGCPIASAIACALAKASGKPVIIEKEEPTSNGKVEIQYRLIEEEN